MDYKDFLEHTCRIDTKQDIVDVLTPPGFLYNCRVWLRRYTMSSDTDQRSLMLLKSNYAVRLDRKRHYNLHFWTIHPLSDARSAGEKTYIAMFLLSVCLYPFTIDFDYPVAIYLNFILDVTFIENFVIQFFVGYVDQTRKMIVLDRRLITKRYLLSFFIIDLVTSLPMNFIVYLCNIREPVTPILRGLRLIRVISVLDLMKLQQQRHGYSEVFTKIGLICFLYTMGIWCGASLILLKRELYHEDEEEDVPQLFIKVVHKVTMVLALANVDNDHDVELQFTFNWLILFLSWGYIMSLVVITNYLIIVSRSQSSEFQFKNMKEQVVDYCAEKQLTSLMRERLDTYYNFRYQQHFYNEVDIHDVLTDHLKQEIQVACMRRHVESVDIFSQLPIEILIEITLAFKTEYFLSTDIIIKQNTTCDSIYIISLGTVAVYDSHRKEVCHLEDGCYLGELAMLFDVERDLPTTVAISPCQMFVLHKKSFESIMRNHKEEMNNMYARAEEKLQKTLYVMQHQGYQFIPPQVVVAECTL